MYWLLYIIDLCLVLFLCTTAVWQFAINEYVMLCYDWLLLQHWGWLATLWRHFWFSSRRRHIVIAVRTRPVGKAKLSVDHPLIHSTPANLLLIGQLIGNRLIGLRPLNQVICLRSRGVRLAALANVTRTRPTRCTRAGGRFCPQNWLPWQRPLRYRKNNQIVHLRPKFYQSCKFREDRSFKTANIKLLSAIAKHWLV